MTTMTPEREMRAGTGNHSRRRLRRQFLSTMAQAQKLDRRPGWKCDEPSFAYSGFPSTFRDLWPRIGCDGMRLKHCKDFDEAFHPQQSHNIGRHEVIVVVVLAVGT